MTLVVAEEELEAAAYDIGSTLTDLRQICMRLQSSLQTLGCQGLQSDKITQAISDYLSQIKVLESEINDLSGALGPVVSAYLSDIDEIDQFMY